MLLKKLELLGFKSFPEKLKIEFGPGITCIVGPNGCGKTNIADAIRWVLGEQSAKALRGGSMGDVIFNGTARRKAVGMADVTLTFSNSGTVLPHGYEDTSINRRLYRDGVSEYSLNKTPCRLKDIRDTFFDTGVGSHAYSLIEQEMVDNVLNDQGGQRRLLFEEAAGITKYKVRKREALLKLDATESDLVRLNDILTEIEREANSLRRQIAKARRFKRLEDEVRTLDLSLGWLAYKGHDEQVGLTSAQLEAWQAKREEAVTSTRSVEADIERSKLVMLEEEKGLSAAAEVLAEVEELRAGVGDQILVLNERRQALNSKCAELRDDIQQVQERIKAGVAQAEETSSELDAVQAALVDKERLVKEREKDITLKDLQLAGVRNELESLKERLDKARGQETQRAAKLDEISSLRGELERQTAAVAEEEGFLSGRLSELKRIQGEAEGEASSWRLELSRLESQIAENDGGKQSLERDTAEASGSESALSGEAQKLGGLLAALERTAMDHDGRREVMRRVLRESSAKVVGILEDLVRVPPELCAAFDAMLYEYGPVVIAADRDSAENCFEALRETFPGRFSVLVPGPERYPGARVVPEADSAGLGVLGEAAGFVECPEELKSALAALLSGSLLVEKVRDIGGVPGRGAAEVRFVSRDGGTMLRGNLLTGGRPAEPGTLEVQSELTNRRAELEAVRASLAESRRTLAQLAAEKARLDEVGRDLLAKSSEAREALSSREKRVSASAAEVSLTEARLASLDTSRRELDHRTAKLSGDLSGLEEELAGLRSSLSPMAEEFDRQSAVVRALEEDRETAIAQLSELRMSEVREFSRKNGLMSLLRRLEEERALLEAEVSRKSRALSESSAQLEGSGAELARLEEEAGKLDETQAERQAALELAKSAYGSARAQIEGLEVKLKALRKEQDEISERVHSLEMDLTRQRIEREGELRRIHSDYGVDLTAESVTIPEGFEPDEARQRLERLRQVVRGLGPVNLLALEEYEKRKERLEFIQNQRDDLLQAKGSLLEVIQKINEKASEMFMQTFNSVQEKFQETFTTLFEGGAAEMRLVGDDPLEAGIEIVARPKGKTLQGLNLLSGGEKALTVIALLFAVYLVKPSPFCMLDEVDAPLDDANIDRFLRMLKRFDDRTQFIVITHNKKTMESAHCLYGVTMQEPGVSKVVSVKFKGNGDAPGKAPAQTEETVEVEA
ncbi:MAG: chromosome segregation protein SMC [Candidatus Eisenbacteria bacterium]|nr:chromosome segregation protein SMC [Candidatus Eisenbacteria bacterium]